MSKGEFWTHHRIKAVREIARKLRHRPTESEQILWEALRNRKLAGVKFLRQHPIGSSIVDFYCHEKLLAVEIDGPVHRQVEVTKRDQARQELIEMYGIRFYRCSSQEVEEDLEGVLKGIQQAMEEQASP